MSNPIAGILAASLLLAGTADELLVQRFLAAANAAAAAVTDVEELAFGWCQI